MGEDTSKKLVGQPIFKQLLNLIPRGKFDLLVSEKKADKYYKTFTSWQHLTTMLFGIFSRCDSMNEICDAMMALQGKLNYLGIDSSVASSTAGDGLRNRNNDFFKDLYFQLIAHFKPILSVSRIEQISFDKFFIFDSTTIRLFSDIMKGVGRNPKNDGKKKGGLKVHMLIDAHADCATYARISEAKMHDKQFLQHLKLAAHSVIVFDKAYNHYLQFAKWTVANISFVCRSKDNIVFEVVKDICIQPIENKQATVFQEQYINIKYKEDKTEKVLMLRKVSYRDEKGRIYQFISNNFDITNEEIAFLYKKRWNIELLFKKLKQNFQLHFFYSETENGIKTQIWCTLIAQLLLMVLKVKTKTIKAFSTICALIRIHLTSMLELFWLLQNTKRTYIKKEKRNKAPGIQIELF